MFSTTKDFLKKIISHAPIRWQQNIKKSYYAYAIKRGQFSPDEPEYNVLDSLISKGDWIIDIGSNVGHYTLRFSELVGENGRVFAFEPVPETFDILAANTQLFKYKNVTLLNLGATDIPSISSISIPLLKTGQKNYYMSSISEERTDLNVYCLPVDSIPFSHSIRLIKIDVEGHELQVLNGMKKILMQDHPVIIIETESKQVFDLLEDFGYHRNKLPDSPNYIFQFSENNGNRRLSEDRQT